jgi:hypothetical protein
MLFYRHGRHGKWQLRILGERWVVERRIKGTSGIGRRIGLVERREVVNRVVRVAGFWLVERGGVSGLVERGGVNGLVERREVVRGSFRSLQRCGVVG